MGPKQRLITTAWCAITMAATAIVSHGHLVMREIMTRWPNEDSWEGRFENAIYTQGGLVLLGSLFVGSVLLIRGYLARVKEEELLRRELAQRERHERAAAQRHDALMDSLARLSGGTEPKKSLPSGVKPR